MMDEKVQFDEKNLGPLVADMRQRKTSGLIRWLMNHSGGKIKTEKQAEIILVAFSILIFIISIYLAFSGNKGSESINAIPANASPETINP